MGNHSSREKTFSENNIDPYVILSIPKTASKKDVKLAYKKKALELHPDKTGGKTELEFRILKECYLHLTESFDEVNKALSKETNSHDKLKESFNDNSEIQYDEDRNFYKQNFTENSSRDKLFSNNNLDFDNFDQEIKKREKGPKNYSDVNKKSYKNIFGDSSKFDIDQFNAVFTENFSKIDKPVTPREPAPLNGLSSFSPMPIATYGGIIMEDENNDFGNFMDYRKLQSNDVDTVNRVQEYDNLSDTISKNKINTDAMSKGDMMKKYNTRKSESVNIDNSKSFAEAQEELLNLRISSMKRDMETNKDKIMSRIDIFPKSIADSFKQGTLEDSSTCISGNTLSIPKGIRNE